MMGSYILNSGLISMTVMIHSDYETMLNLMCLNTSHNALTNILEFRNEYAKKYPTRITTTLIHKMNRFMYTFVTKWLKPLLDTDDKQVLTQIGNGVIYTVMLDKHIELTKLLLNDKRISILQVGPPALADLNIAQLLLDDGRIDPSMDDNYAIKQACKNNNIGLVQLLLSDARVIVSYSCFKIAIKEGYNDLIDILLTCKTIIREFNSLLNTTIIYNRPYILDSLLNDTRFNLSMGMMLYGVSQGFLDIIQVFIDYGYLTRPIIDRYLGSKRLKKGVRNLLKSI